MKTPKEIAREIVDKWVAKFEPPIREDILADLIRRIEIEIHVDRQRHL